MSSASAAKVQEMVLPPVVSSDPNSNISQMARDAKKLQVQSQTDSRYDTNLDRDGNRVSADTNTLKESFSASMDELPDNTMTLLAISSMLFIVFIWKIRSRK